MNLDALLNDYFDDRKSKLRDSLKFADPEVIEQALEAADQERVSYVEPFVTFLKRRLDELR